MSTDYIDTNEAARRTGLKPATLRRRRCSGLPPLSVRHAGRVLYPVAELEAWVAEQDRQSARGKQANEVEEQPSEKERPTPFPPHSEKVSELCRQLVQQKSDLLGKLDDLRILIEDATHSALSARTLKSLKDTATLLGFTDRLVEAAIQTLEADL